MSHVTYPRILARVGNWPKAQDIQRITKITVYKGDIIDSVRITYQVVGGKLVTVQHGGDGGNKQPDIDIDGDIFSCCYTNGLLTPGIYDEYS